MHATYNPWLVTLSVIVAILVSYTALRLTERVAGAERRAGLLWLLGGATSMGTGICGMHYTGMAAIQIMPDITYSPLLVGASVAIAITASFVALWLFFRLRSGESRLMKLARAGAAVVMGLAIAGMHYTAMAA